MSLNLVPASNVISRREDGCDSSGPGSGDCHDDHGDDEHTATSTAFETGTLDPGQSATTTLDTRRYTYIYQFHADMRGAIVVIDPAATPTAGPSEGATLVPVGSPEPAAYPAASETATFDVSIVDFAFEAETLTIPPGTPVNWTNEGVAPHTVSGAFADPGQTFSFTFDELGRV